MSPTFLLGVTPSQIAANNESFPFLFIQMSTNDMMNNPCTFGQKIELTPKELLERHENLRNNSESIILFREKMRSYHLRAFYDEIMHHDGRNQKELASFITNELFKIAQHKPASKAEIKEAKKLAQSYLRDPKQTKFYKKLDWYRLEIDFDDFKNALTQWSERIHQNYCATA